MRGSISIPLCMAVMVSGISLSLRTWEKRAAQAILASPAACALELSDRRHDFGRVSAGAALKHTFRWKNVGTDPVVLSTVHVSCGCLTHDESRVPIGPGERGTVTIELRTAGVHPPARLEKHVQAAPRHPHVDDPSDRLLHRPKESPAGIAERQCLCRGAIKGGYAMERDDASRPACLYSSNVSCVPPEPWFRGKPSASKTLRSEGKTAIGRPIPRCSLAPLRLVN